jgi:LacI family transcriptional regulator
MLVNMPTKVTSFDVARLAGVSQPTVSRALRNLPGVSPVTRTRVVDAARQLSYIPSDSGRTLSTRVSRRVAVVAPELDNPYYPQLIEPLRRELAQEGLRTVLVTDELASASDPRLLDDLADASYDGVILTTTRRRSRLPRDLTERGIPHVLANRVLDVPESPACAIDNDHGSRLVADLLVELGHQRIAVVGGPVDTSTGKERTDGLRAALTRAGRHVRRDLIVRCEFEHDAGLSATRALLARADRPTAVVCGNDVIALGALSAARSMGLRVPDDVTIVGFDDIPMAGWPIVELTTVRCDLAELARQAIRLLVGAIAAPDVVPDTVRIRPHLVRRGTHATVV